MARTPTYKSPTGTRWVTDDKAEGAGTCISDTRYNSGCSACPAYWYQSCDNGGTAVDYSGCGFGGCKLKCTNNCYKRNYGCPDDNVRDMGCGCGQGEDCLYTVPELTYIAATSGPWTCANAPVDYHTPEAGATSLPDSKTCAELKELEWCVKDLMINTRGGEYAPLWMQSNCAKTCGHCNTACNLAKDKYSRKDCVVLRSQNGCRGSSATFMRENCSGTCGYCKADLECQVRPVADAWPSIRHPDDTSTCAEAEATMNICSRGEGKQNTWWKDNCTSDKAETFACRTYKFQHSFIWGPQKASQCANTCGICSKCDPKNCGVNQVFMEDECKDGRNGCMDVSSVLRFECLDLQVPSMDSILQNYCSDGMIDVLHFSEQSTDGIPIEMSLTTSTENSFTRTSETAFTNENGWNLEEMDETMKETSKSTEVLVKDPEVSSSTGGGFEVAGIGASFEKSDSHSCMNENTEICRFTNYSLAPTNDPNMCKCTETTTTTTETERNTHATTKGEMETQSDTLSNGFVTEVNTYFAETATWTCPEYSECMYAQYTVTTTCSIPYWGKCTIVFDEKDSNGNNISKDLDIDMNDDNKFLLIKSAKKSKTYLRNSGKLTDGKECGIQLTPAVDNSMTAEIREWLACPKSTDIKYLPHCDCMLGRFKDCSTSLHPDDILSVGDMCQLGNRPFVNGYSDDAACLSSQTTWIQVSSCSNAHVYYVGGYHDATYRRLVEGIRGPLPPVVINVEYAFDMVRDYGDRAQHDQSGGYTHDGSVLLDGNSNTFWNVVGLPPYHETWYVVFDTLNSNALVTEFKIKNFGDSIHDVRRCYLQSGNSKDAIHNGGGSLFTLTTGHSDWQTFTNNNPQPGRYWKLQIIETSQLQPWIREVEFVTQVGEGGTRRLQAADHLPVPAVGDDHLPAPGCVDC